MPELDPNSYLPLIKLAFDEDFGNGDITSQAIIPPHHQGEGRLTFRSAGVVCGMPVVKEVLHFYDNKLHLQELVSDGQPIAAAAAAGIITGPLRSLLAAERVALNFLQRLSGIATLTHRYVAAVAGTGAKIYDTRKTAPGWRHLEKYAVRCGGGHNHRLGLFDAALIKDNHLAALSKSDLKGNLEQTIKKLKAAPAQPAFIEVEVDNLDQLRTVLQVDGVDIILLDNMSLEQLTQAVQIRRDRAKSSSVLLEASGNINLDNVKATALTGVDRISVGAITHSANNLDISLELA